MLWRTVHCYRKTNVLKLFMRGRHLKWEDWAVSLRDELLTLGLLHISQGRQEGSGRANYQIIKIRRPDMQTQMSIDKMGEEIFSCMLIFEKREKERITRIIIYITYSYMLM